MSDLSAPLVATDVDVRDLDGFMLNVERLMASELVALSSHEVVAAALFLWCRAWKQLPAASLPDDDRVIAAFARLPLPRFHKLKTEVLRGFVKCSDGRLYHRTLAGEATAAYARKKAFKDRRGKEAERLRQWRSKRDENGGETPIQTPHETQCETDDETRFVREGQGQGRYGKRPKEEGVPRERDNPPPVLTGEPAPPRKRGRRSQPEQTWPADFVFGDKLREHAAEHGFPGTAGERLFEKFEAKSLAKGWTNRDWGAAFRNFVLNEHPPPTRANGSAGEWRPPDC